MAGLAWQDRLLTLADGTQIHALHGRHRRNQDRCNQNSFNQDKSLPTLVLLHEALGHIAMWKAFPQRLAEATGLDLSPPPGVAGMPGQK